MKAQTQYKINNKNARNLLFTETQFFNVYTELNYCITNTHYFVQLRHKMIVFLCQQLWGLSIQMLSCRNIQQLHNLQRFNKHIVQFMQKRIVRNLATLKKIIKQGLKSITAKSRTNIINNVHEHKIKDQCAIYPVWVYGMNRKFFTNLPIKGISNCILQYKLMHF